MFVESKDVLVCMWDGGVQKEEERIKDRERDR